mmetsp:Transcript_91761/g.126497  ORF Transcript_91761/g.126497 Transcript_91761/m.126497 type:complete len:87 (-) Transcript_91761:274-534(-)
MESLKAELALKYETRNEYDKTIAETEAAFQKILQSSTNLLKVLSKDPSNKVTPQQAEALVGNSSVATGNTMNFTTTNPTMNFNLNQ